MYLYCFYNIYENIFFKPLDPDKSGVTQRVPRLQAQLPTIFYYTIITVFLYPLLTNGNFRFRFITTDYADYTD